MQNLHAAHCTSVIAEVPESERKSQVRSPAGKANTLYSTSLRIFSRSSGFTDSKDLTATVVCEGGLSAVVCKGRLSTVGCEGCLEILNGVDAPIFDVNVLWMLARLRYQ